MVATEMPIVSPPSAPTNASANLVSVETEDNATVVQWVLYCLSPVIDRNQQIWVKFINPFHFNDWKQGENYGKCTDWNLNFRVINCLNNTTPRLCYSIVVRNVFLVFNSHFSFFCCNRIRSLFYWQRWMSSHLSERCWASLLQLLQRI